MKQEFGTLVLKLDMKQKNLSKLFCCEIRKNKEKVGLAKT